jgi:DNA-binding MarR family transcriptional regulator
LITQQDEKGENIMEQLEHFTTFILAIDRISKNIKRVKDQEMEDYGLRSPHIMVLFHIADKNGLDSTRLAEACGVDKSFISRITTELENDDYIKREMNTHGKIYRGKFLLTEKGAHITSVIQEKVSAIVKEVGGNIPDHKKKTFYDVLAAFDENIAKIIKDGKER